MTEQDVRRIIREELAKFSFSDRFFIYKNMQFADGVSIQTGLTNGLKIGTSESEKLAFFGITPVVQQASIADADGTLASATTQINQVLDLLDAYGLTA
jgi:hypothetical protein